jgi:hypothetical protein
MSAIGNKDVRRVRVARQHLHNEQKCGEDPGLQHGEGTEVSLSLRNFLQRKAERGFLHLLLQILCILPETGHRRGYMSPEQIRGEPICSSAVAQVAIGDKEDCAQILERLLKSLKDTDPEQSTSKPKRSMPRCESSTLPRCFR